MDGQKSGTMRSRKAQKKATPGEESSDSTRSRSLSTGRSAHRHGDLTRDPAKSQSKWLKNKKKSSRISSSDGENDDFTDSVSKRVKERRLRRERLNQAKAASSQANSELGPPRNLCKTG